MNDPAPDGSIFKLIAGVAGAVVSLRFVQGSLFERFLMTTGGAALSYFGTTPFVQWQQVPKSAEGLIGFLIGLFGMMIVAKLYEGIQALDSVKLMADGWETLKRKWGA